MKRSKAPSALAAKKARTDEATSSKTEASTIDPKIKKTDTKDSEESYHSTATPSPAPTPSPTQEHNTQPKSTTNPLSTKSGGSFRTPFKSPITSATKVASKAEASEEPKESIIYTVLWCNFTTKKHKTWNDGIYTQPPQNIIKLIIIQGVLVITGTRCVLKDMEGKELGKTISYSKKTLDDLTEGNTLKVAGKDMEVSFIFPLLFRFLPSLSWRPLSFLDFVSDHHKILKRIPEDEYNSGRVFLASQTGATISLSSPHHSYF